MKLKADKEILLSKLVKVIKFIPQKSIIPIPITGLKHEEIRTFHNIRSYFINGCYLKTTQEISTLLENKLRNFIYSVFLLQFDDRKNRMSYIPYGYHKYINENSDKDKQRGWTESKNELTYLNRHQYRGILFGPKQPGGSNWNHIFSKIFIGWDFTKMNSYFLNFFDFNIIASHNKEILESGDRSELLQHITDSIKFIININKSYEKFFQNLQKKNISGYSDHEYYFTLDNYDDKYRLRSVRFSSDAKERIIKSLEISKTHVIDLSDPNILEQRYGIKYREIFALLTILIKESARDLNIKDIRWEHPFLVIERKQ